MFSINLLLIGKKKKMIDIKIDDKSGFCFGVVMAIEKAEKELETVESLYCLGDIVHNNVEVKRLESKGLISIDYDKFEKLSNCKVLIRAHGEPPSTYETARKNNIELIDASCPVVLKLQERIKLQFNGKEEEKQIVIYGKQGHAEVNGLVGQTNSKAIVVSEISDIKKIDFSKDIYLFSQTTQSIEEYTKIQVEIKKYLIDSNDLFVHKSICGQVSNRWEELREFSNKHEVIIFVSGKKSSNGRILHNVCKIENDNTYFINDSDDIKKEMFDGIKSVGICGATSTPRWLMEKIEGTILNLL